jgi:hypothetical protein
MADELEKIEVELAKLIAHGRDVVANENPDPFDIDRTSMKLSIMLSNISQIYRRYEYRANKWKDYGRSVREIIRSLRKVHETLIEERRMTK